MTWPDAPADTIQTLGHRNAESMWIIPCLQLVVACKCRNSAEGATFPDANRYLRILVQASQ